MTFFNFFTFSLFNSKKKNSFGYKTAFAYIKEAKEGNVSKEEKEKNVGMRVLCGKFSYAEIPKKYDLIMGVTGTLDKLNSTQKKIVKEMYNIKKDTFMPSLYGERKFKFAETKDVHVVVDHDKFHLRIYESAKKVVEEERAVLIFFENDKTLKDFKRSNYCEFQDIEELTPLTKDRDAVVRKSTRSKHVTLVTRDFGRGIDFITNDSTVKKKGGLFQFAFIFQFCKEHQSFFKKVFTSSSLSFVMNHRRRLK